MWPSAVPEGTDADPRGAKSFVSLLSALYDMIFVRKSNITSSEIHIKLMRLKFYPHWLNFTRIINFTRIG